MKYLLWFLLILILAIAIVVVFAIPANGLAMVDLF